MKNEFKQVSESWMVNAAGEAINPDGRTVKADKVGYRYFIENGNKTYLHRTVWEAFNGLIPPHLIVTHIDGNRGNNALANLCLTTRKATAKRASNAGNLHSITTKKNIDTNLIRDLIGYGKFSTLQIANIANASYNYVWAIKQGTRG